MDLFCAVVLSFYMASPFLAALFIKDATSKCGLFLLGIINLVTVLYYLMK